MVEPVKKDKPLVMVNGVEWKKSIDDIAPETIDNIKVLKNSADTEKYGEKGKNGVIVVTLKEGTTQH